MVLLVPMLARADDEATPEAEAERLGVVVRAGARDATIVSRLRGQLADLDRVTLEIEASDAIEPTLDGQLATAERLATAYGARVVVWFVARGNKLAVAIATPLEQRLFVREIPPAAESAMAEAAAIAVRGAVRSISLGGTIGVELAKPPIEVAPPPPPPARTTRPATTLDASLGWQIAIDGGAARGAHALVQRTTISRASWAASLALTLGMPLEWRAASDVVLDVSRSGAIVGGERRLAGGIALGIGAGALIYHRSTATAPAGLAPTPSTSTIAFAGVAEVAWRTRVTSSIAIVATAAVDVVAGAPEAAIERAAMVETIDTIRAVQPRAALAVEVGAW
jgi:hypothetical protein